MSQRGPAVVRFSLLLLVFAAFAMALVQPGQAGTETSPEIQDAAGDHEAGGAAPLCAPQVGCQLASADLISGWVSNETATDLTLSIKVAHADPNGGNANGNPTTRYQYDFDLTVGGTAYTATVELTYNKQLAASGAATAAVIQGSIITMTVPKANIGNPAAGTEATALALESRLVLPPVPGTIVSDSASSEAKYLFTGGATNGTVAGDSDNDGLNDTCEQQYFGGLNSTHNGTGDADGDGLTNGQECALGTDPTKADTDGDGTGDKDDPFPSDPTKGGTSSGSGSGSSSGSRSSSSSRSSSNTGTDSETSSTSGGAQGDGEVKNLDDAIDRLRSDASYVGMSAGGFLTVVVLAILALAVRWSL